MSSRAALISWSWESEMSNPSCCWLSARASQILRHQPNFRRSENTALISGEAFRVSKGDR